MTTRLQRAIRLLGCLCLLACSSPTSAAVDTSLADDIRHELRQQRLAGAVWSLVDADGTVTEGAAGERDAVAHLPMTSSTRVHIGSVTKTLIAVGALRLVTQGKLALDAPIEPFLGGVRIDNPWASRRPVTLRTLLDHTAGLDDGRLNQMFSLRTSPEMPLREAFVAPAPALVVRQPPGESFSYSNTGYTLVAIAIETVVGERYEDWLQRELLQPLDMRDSTFHFVHQQTREGQGLAWGHLDDLRRIGALPVVLRPAGQFTTTARDMARFARFLLGDGRAADGRRLVDTPLLRMMGQPSGTAAARSGLPAGYGLGLGTQIRAGVAGACHSGSIVGYRAMLCLYPAQRKAFFLSINTDAEDADYRAFDARMVSALSLQPEGSIPAPAVARWTGEDPRGLYRLDPSRFEAFRYFDRLTAIVRLRDGGGGVLELAPLEGKVRRLQPWPGGIAGGQLYSAEPEVGPTHVLHVGLDGRLRLSDGYRSYVRTAEWQWWALWSNLALGVAGLVWFLLVAPWRGLRAPARAALPGIALAWGWGLVAALFLFQPLLALGDLTPASGGLYAMSCAMIPLALWQVWRSLRQTSRWARADLLAALAILQWSAVLVWHGALPFALWR